MHHRYLLATKGSLFCQLSNFSNKSLFPNKPDKHDEAATLNLGSIFLRTGFGVIYERTKWSGMRPEEYKEMMVIGGLGKRGQASCLLMGRVEKIEGVML